MPAFRRSDVTAFEAGEDPCDNPFNDGEDDGEEDPKEDHQDEDGAVEGEGGKATGDVHLVWGGCGEAVSVGRQEKVLIVLTKYN